MGCINIVGLEWYNEPRHEENALTSLHTMSIKSFEFTNIAGNMMHEQSIFLDPIALPFSSSVLF
jgi:hypothetical protein